MQVMRALGGKFDSLCFLFGQPYAEFLRRDRTHELPLASKICDVDRSAEKIKERRKRARTRTHKTTWKSVKIYDKDKLYFTNGYSTIL